MLTLEYSIYKDVESGRKNSKIPPTPYTNFHVFRWSLSLWVWAEPVGTIKCRSCHHECDCLTSSSVAVRDHWDQGNLAKEGFVWAYKGLQRVRAYHHHRGKEQQQTGMAGLSQNN